MRRASWQGYLGSRGSAGRRHCPSTLLTASPGAWHPTVLLPTRCQRPHRGHSPHTASVLAGRTEGVGQPPSWVLLPCPGGPCQAVPPLRGAGPGLPPPAVGRSYPPCRAPGDAWGCCRGHLGTLGGRGDCLWLHCPGWLCLAARQARVTASSPSLPRGDSRTPALQGLAQAGTLRGPASAAQGVPLSRAAPCAAWR